MAGLQAHTCASGPISGHIVNKRRCKVLWPLHITPEQDLAQPNHTVFLQICTWGGGECPRGRLQIHSTSPRSGYVNRSSVWDGLERGPAT